MAQNTKHIRLNECRPCVVLMRDTFAGVLSDVQPNNCNITVQTPIKYFQELTKTLNEKLHKRNPNGNYAVSIKVSPKDHRTFLSAVFKYGRRELSYTNVSSLPRVNTKQESTFCIKETTITATRIFNVRGKGDKWVNDHTATWNKAGYKGKFHTYESSNGTIYTGYFEHQKDDKKLKVTSKRNNARYITFTLVQTVVTNENIRANENPKLWVRDIDSAMKKDKFEGYINTHINSYDKLIISGSYNKTIKVDKGGTNAYVVRFYNQTERVKSTPAADPESWRPTRKLGKHIVQVRSIAQDDHYTPEFTGKRINRDRMEIDRLYKEYMQMPAKELELSEKRFEAMTDKANSKGQQKALKWLRSIKATNPAWLQAPNAYNLANYCIKYIEREIMTPSEATNFCKNNAYKSK